MRRIDGWQELPEIEAEAAKPLNVSEKFFEKYKSYEEIKELRKYCNIYGVKFIFQPFLARGLSYYDGNIFEIKSDIKETIFGGGSYTFNGIKAVGFGVSIERLSIVSQIKPEKEKCLIISLNQDKKAIELEQKLREKDKIISIYYGKPSKALDYANAYNFNKVIFVGEKEVKSKKFKIKDMKSGKENLLKI